MKTCTHGHELVSENIVIRHGRERCRACEHEHGRRYREKQRQLAAAAPKPNETTEASE